MSIRLLLQRLPLRLMAGELYLEKFLENALAAIGYDGESGNAPVLQWWYKHLLCSPFVPAGEGRRRYLLRLGRRKSFSSNLNVKKGDLPISKSVVQRATL